MAQILPVPQKSKFPPVVLLLAQFTISRKSRWNYELIGTYVRMRKLSRTSAARVAAAKRPHSFAFCPAVAKFGFPLSRHGEP